MVVVKTKDMVKKAVCTQIDDVGERRNDASVFYPHIRS